MRPTLGDEKLTCKDNPAKHAAFRDRLFQLYVVERKGTPEIARIMGVATHKSVLHALEVHGIPRRGMGPTKLLHCSEPGCMLPVHRVRHACNGAWYGRRCRLHWIIFRMFVNQRYNDKTLKLGKDEAWLRRMRQLLRRVQRLNREACGSPRTASRQATISLA